MELALVGYRMRVTVERARRRPLLATSLPLEQVVTRKDLVAEVEKRREETQIRLGEASYFRLG